ncbi:hypothetical protein F5Y00DRAFT_238713 [Daldinia vernicosa]|uniref:uncharacterized protein n=1 Tax=Daldinia vernicosa TaxID=114800 RepID=UPI002007E35A|nr:uncharacterized protein F5Y00DRAFT_238713 [Daldinia vernicosa]KAI0848274.1 hypothetical protein F5Y00DRAFT_238713 [Daldinia vernicosa]
MSFTTRSVALVGLMAFFSKLSHAQSVPIAYCASINTASTTGNSSIYQSDGLCHDFCVASFAFAIVQDEECWCSDYVPDEATQVDTDECDTACPGYPSDLCGGDGLWGYMSLNNEPSGTKSGGSASSTKTSAPDTSKTTGDSSTTPTTPSVSTVTAGGTVKTVTIMPTVTSDPDAATSPDTSSSEVPSNQQHGLSTGAAVGVAIGVFIAVGMAIGIAVFFWLRRKRRDQGDAFADSPGSQRGSSAGMMSTPTTAMASVWDGDTASGGRRNSRFMPHDPRMDPFAANIYSRENKSQESINTLQDNHDYSRKVLRTTNPDPPDGE